MRDALTQAQEIIRAAIARPGAAALTCSFQAEDVAVLHLLRAAGSKAAVLFLDTGYHFPEVIAYRDELALAWNLDIVNLRAPAPTAHPDDVASCCHQRKVEPLMAGLAAYDTWFTGLRREQSPTRAGLQPEEQHKFPNGLALHKVSPLYDWTSAEVFAYCAANDIPLLPLYAEGYPSIGCQPCTSKPAPGESARSGRWGGQKLECGLHTVTIKEG